MIKTSKPSGFICIMENLESQFGNWKCGSHNEMHQKNNTVIILFSHYFENSYLVNFIKKVVVIHHGKVQ